jgi:hypothetical protein
VYSPIRDFLHARTTRPALTLTQREVSSRMHGFLRARPTLLASRLTRREEDLRRRRYFRSRLSRRTSSLTRGRRSFQICGMGIWEAVPKIRTLRLRRSIKHWKRSQAAARFWFRSGLATVSRGGQNQSSRCAPNVPSRAGIRRNLSSFIRSTTIRIPPAGGDESGSGSSCGRSFK